MIANISHYLDEGFEIEDMKAFLFKQRTELYFKENPDRFTIANLFPIRDQDRMTICWDQLAHFKSMREKKAPEKMGLLIRLHCGHSSTISHKYCAECIKNGDLNEIAKNPYAEEIPSELKEWSDNFKKRAEESGDEYIQRTAPFYDELRKFRK
jgi:hypothetical protein